MGTEIASHDLHHIWVRGHDLCSEVMGQRTFAAGTWRKYMQMTFEEVALSTRTQPLRPGADAIDPHHRSFAGAGDDPGVIHRRQQRGQRHLQPVSYSMENGKRWVGVTVLEL